MKDVNIFVISHTPDKLIDKFKNVITIKKKGNFSNIEEEGNY
jgi:dimeric dUTPase (all-alpha-NTP-PPase superfamily)